MKKRKGHGSRATPDPKKTGEQQQQEEKPKKKATLPESGCDSEDENEGFGNWLRSTDGVAYMRLFVVANSLLVCMTMSWSHVWHVIDIVREMIGF